MVIMDTKRCTRCETTQSLDQFLTIFKRGKETLSSWCRACRTEAAREHRHAQPELYRASDRRRYAERTQSPEYRKYQREYKRMRRRTESGKREIRKFQLAAKYGLTPEDYDRMLAEQDGVCAICKSPPEPEKFLHIDHCHATNRVRRLLCPECNRGLGAFCDDVVRLLAAADYLREFAAA